MDFNFNTKDRCPGRAPLSSRPIGRLAALLVISLGIAAGAQPGPAEADPDVELAAHLAGTVWLEGLPYELARQLGPAGSAYLAHLLTDGTQSRVHANAVLALGMAGRAAAYETLAAYASSHAGSDEAREIQRALRLLPAAMGHLARHDERALAWLVAREAELSAAGDPHAREWIWTSIGLAGTRAAEAALARLASRSAGDARSESVLARARALGDRVRDVGPAQAFADRAAQ